MAASGKHLEIEAKLLVDNLALVESKLAIVGAVLRQRRVFERNIRYDTETGTLTSASIVLRLRHDTRARLTYKGPAQQHDPEESLISGLQTRFEAEVVVSDFDTMDLILQKLGFHRHMIYEKFRTTYELDGAEIALDEMPYGQFIEIEGAPAQIVAVINGLALADYTRFEDSYARLFDYVRANLGLRFTDLTFENFAGITVSAADFRPPGAQPEA